LEKRFTADGLQLRPVSETDLAKAIATKKGICLNDMSDAGTAAISRP
jgi:hypothetical protein